MEKNRFYIEEDKFYINVLFNGFTVSTYKNNNFFMDEARTFIHKLNESMVFKNIVGVQQKMVDKAFDDKKEIIDGGQAFPQLHSIDGNWINEPNQEHAGMSKRFYAATKAMQGLLANSQITKHFETIKSKIEDERKAIVEQSFALADELIKQEGK